MHAMRGAGVEELRRGIAQFVGHRRGLARRVVRQAQDDEVHFRHHVAPRDRIAAMFGGKALQLNVGQRAQPVTDAETRGTGFAIDEHTRLGSHIDPPVMTELTLAELEASSGFHLAVFLALHDARSHASGSRRP